MVTTSVAVQAPSARSTNSIGPGALLDSRSESMVMAWPDGPLATNFCSPIHFMDAVCMEPPCEEDSRCRPGAPFAWNGGFGCADLVMGVVNEGKKGRSATGVPGKRGARVSLDWRFGLHCFAKI